MKKLSLLFLSMISSFFLFSQTPGTLDLSFGDNGISTIDFGGSHNYCYASDVLPDQKIVLGGETSNSTSDISFCRLKPDGSLDIGFGSNGIITFVYGGSEDHIYDVLAQPDGRTLGIGYTSSGGESSMIIVRLNVIGLMDLTFSSDGMLVVDFGPGYDCFGMELALQDDGKIIGLGHIRALNGDVHCALCRVNPDGTMDAGFGTNGIVIQNFLSHELIYTSGVALQGDHIIVGGNSYHNGDHFLTLARFLPSGLLDASFGINGVVSIELNISPWLISNIGAMCLDNENRILFGCYYESLSGTDFAIYRFLPDGQPDNSFGDFGLKVIDLEGDEYVQAITSQYDGKILAGGYNNGDFIIVRCQENGDPDPAFGPSGNGIVISSAGSDLQSLNLQADGLILAAGSEYDGFSGSSDFVAARYYSGLNVGIETPITTEATLEIYPNPAQDQININIPAGEEIKEIIIYNSSGAEFIQLKERFGAIDISSLPRGIYLVEVRFANSTRVGKIIKAL